MPEVTLKVEVSDWNALDINGMTEDEVMREMEEVAYQKLRELQQENGIRCDDFVDENGDE